MFLFQLSTFLFALIVSFWFFWLGFGNLLYFLPFFANPVIVSMYFPWSSRWSFFRLLTRPFLWFLLHDLYVRFSWFCGIFFGCVFYCCWLSLKFILSGCCFHCAPQCFSALSASTPDRSSLSKTLKCAFQVPIKAQLTPVPISCGCPWSVESSWII